MSLDELATAAGEELVGAAAYRTDTAERRRALDRSLTARRRGWATAGMALVALIALLGPAMVNSLQAAPPALPIAPPIPSTQPTTPEPPRYTGNGRILTLTADGFEFVDPATGSREKISPSGMPGTERLGFAPDGSRVAAFVPGRSYVYDVASRRTTVQLGRDSGPFGSNWFPTGRVRWSTDGTFTVESTEGLAPVSAALPKGFTVLWVEWSPDGHEAAFAAANDTTDRRLYVVNADGTGLHELPAKLTPEDDGPFAPVWSPDGSRLLYSEVGPIAVGGGATWSVMTISPDGSNRVKVADGGEAMTMGKWETYPIWSPDSQQIAFLGNLSATENGWRLYVTDLHGHVRAIPTGKRPQLPALAWQPVP